ncbi:hypothetical protein [Roseomonas sp. WA12]
MSAGISVDFVVGTTTRDDVVAELDRLRACAALRGMDSLQALLEAIVNEMSAPSGD